MKFIYRIIYLFQYNFVGRILGPRGLSAKQFEAETGCKLIVRGRGSFRDKRKVRFRFKKKYEKYFFLEIGRRKSREIKL